MQSLSSKIKCSLWAPLAALAIACLPACLEKSADSGPGDQQPVAASGDQQPSGQESGADSAVARDAAQMVGELDALFAEQGIQVNADKGSVSIGVQVGSPRHPVEWLLIHQKGKVHECVFITDAQAAILKAALMTVGYTENGRNVRWEEKDPMPSEDEIMAGAEWVDVFPPEGKQVWMTFDWTDADGKAMSLPVEDLLVDVATGRELTDASWVYLGGRLHPLYRGEDPVFVADYTGNYMSVPYMAPENHLVTMVHERARDESNWWLSKRCPPAGTKGRLTLHSSETPAHKARKQRIASDGARAEEVGEVPPPPDGGPASSMGVPRTPEDIRKRK